MGSSPCRRIFLLGIAHPVVGKYFQVLEVHWDRILIQELNCKKVGVGLIYVFCNILDKVVLGHPKSTGISLVDG